MDERNKSNDLNNPNIPVASVGRKKIQPQTDTPDSSYNAFAQAYLTQRELNNKERQKAVINQSQQPSAPVVIADTAEQDKKDVIYKIIFIFLLILTVVLLAASCVYLFFNKNADDKNIVPEDNNGNHTQEVIKESLDLTSPFDYEQTYNVTFPDGIQEKFKDLYAQNTNFAGWLTVPGTSIDTPVYKTDNNSYYLKHDNFDSYTKYGVPFLDMYNGLTYLSRNTVIYGHNFGNRLIFDEIHDYEDVEYYKKYPVIEYDSLYTDYKWKVFACFRSNGDSSGDNNYLFYYIATDMGNNSFMEFYDEVMQRSYIDTGVDVQPTDKILTLSTCTYFFDKGGRLENARFVLMARLVREGESEYVDTSKAVQRENVRYPQLYYDVFGGTNPYKNASKWKPTND